MSNEIEKNEIEQMERENEDYRQQAAMGQVAKRLKDNKDFKDFILDYFCTKECARYAQVSGDVNLPKESREDAMAVAQAAGHVKRFLNNAIQMGEQAERAIRVNEVEMDQIRAGGPKD